MVPQYTEYLFSNFCGFCLCIPCVTCIVRLHSDYWTPVLQATKCLLAIYLVYLKTVWSSSKSYCTYLYIACGCLQCDSVHTWSSVCVHYRLRQVFGNKLCLPRTLTSVFFVYLIYLLHDCLVQQGRKQEDLPPGQKELIFSMFQFCY